jgi:hypothetical protein
MKHTTLTCRWYDVIVLNVHVTTDDVIVFVKDSSYEKLECNSMETVRYPIS